VRYTIRPYAPSDAPACLAIFDGNTPRFFAPSERGEFAAYLAAPGGGLLVAEAPGAGVVGVGGYYLRAAGGSAPEGGLAWGMVARAWHRRGVGGALLAARLDALWRQGAGAASVRTSQHSRGFFERAGFALVRAVPGGFGPGIDLVELRLPAPAPPGQPRA
jgi:GNAT superfamily N-acetyltransferase